MDDPRKLPPDLALTDWDKLLDDFEPASRKARTKGIPTPVATSPVIPIAPPSDRPTRAVPAQETPQNPAVLDLVFDEQSDSEEGVLTPGRLLDAPTPSYSSSEEKEFDNFVVEQPESSERTMVGRVPAALLEETIRGGTGLGQLLRPSLSPAVEPKGWPAATPHPIAPLARGTEAKTSPPSYEATVLTSVLAPLPSVAIAGPPRPSASLRRAPPVLPQEPPAALSTFDLRELLPSSLPRTASLSGFDPFSASSLPPLPAPIADALPPSSQTPPLPPPRVAFAPPAPSDRFSAYGSSEEAVLSSSSRWPDERDAAVYLAETGHLEEWAQRASWLEDEARRREDRTIRARLFLSVSELLAMSGEEARAEPLAKEARDLSPNSPLLHRQARARLAREGVFDQLLPNVDAEARLAPTPEARTHGALLGAELCRLVLDDPEGAIKRTEQAARSTPNDPRAHVIKHVTLLSEGGTPAKPRWPDADELTPLADAVQTLWAIRGAVPVAMDTTAPPSVVASFAHARNALARGDLAAASHALAALGELPNLGPGVLWLASVLAIAVAEARAASVPWLEKLRQFSDQASLATRTLARVNLELGQGEECRALVLAAAVFSPLEKVSLGALTGVAHELLGPALQQLRAEPIASPLVSAVEALTESAGGSEEKFATGLSSAQVYLALGRSLGREGKEQVASTVEAQLRAVAAIDPDAPLLRVFALERCVSAGATADVAKAVASWPFSSEPSHGFVRDRSLAAVLLFEQAGDRETAAMEANHAHRADPTSEEAVRCRLAFQSEGEDDATEGLASLAETSTDPIQRALLLLEIVRRRSSLPSTETSDLIAFAADAAPALPFAVDWGIQWARNAGDADQKIAWLRRRRNASDDETETVEDLVSEALLLVERDAATAALLLEQASQRHPSDIALRELFERFAPAAPSDRGAWLAARAEEASSNDWRNLWLLLAAWDYEQAGDFEAVLRCSRQSIEYGAEGLAVISRDRSRALGPEFLPFAEELWRQAEQASDTATRKEAYERLIFLDELVRPDDASSLAWHRAYLELEPTSLPSLRRVEQILLRGGKEDELEAVFAQLARVTEGTESAAHARVAARIRARHQEWTSTFDLVALAASVPQPDLWALRQRFVHAMLRQDRSTLLRTAQVLATKTDLPADVAVLSLRAAEAAEGEGQSKVARELLGNVLDLAPEHPIAHLLSINAWLNAGDFPHAARACEEAAAASNVDAHQANFLYQAACLWTDQVGDKERGTLAFEAVLQRDVQYEDAPARLQALYIELGERAKLADLLERRLEAVQDPEKRGELEVIRGRALADVGDLEGAKQALRTALVQRPEDPAALQALGDVSVQQGDWSGAEQVFLHLARLASEPTAQIDLYLRLGEIYRKHLHNPARAEESYREILRRRPDDLEAAEWLIVMFCEAGNVEPAIKMQQTLLAAAKDPEEKRARTVRLAGIYEDVSGDLRKAETILEALRKETPHDQHVLRALAEFHLRHQQGSAVNILLDRTAADARRALTTGRFDLHYFANLALVFELRQRNDSALTAHGTLAALEGRSSDVKGIGPRAAQGLLDDFLAPDILTPAFRSLLRQAGDALDTATMPDLKGLLRATTLPPSADVVLEFLRVMAPAFGLPPIQAHVSPKLGAVCLPICSNPPTVILGAPLLSDACDAVRPFLIFRALKILQRQASAFARTPPIDLWPLVVSFLQLFAPQWEPQGVIDSPKVSDLRARLQRALPTSLGHDVSVLALEVIGSIGNRASTLQTAVHAWGNRCALLAFGDMNTALQALAQAAGLPHGPPASGAERLTWIARNAEARDLVVYSVSDPYAEARSQSY